VPKQIYFWAAFFWTGIVTFLCLIQLNNVPFESVSNLDKLVHVFFHFVFTSLWFLFLKKKWNGTKISKPLAISVVFSVFFGISIEILQDLCTTNRKADIFDVVANTSGAILAVIAIILLHKYNNRKTWEKDKI